MVKKILTKVLNVLGQVMPTLPQRFLDLTQFEDGDEALHAPGLRDLLGRQVLTVTLKRIRSLINQGRSPLKSWN